ncbi:hypothetical protein OROHE_012250 [Orobanche hederae]
MAANRLAQANSVLAEAALELSRDVESLVLSTVWPFTFREMSNLGTSEAEAPRILSTHGLFTNLKSDPSSPTTVALLDHKNSISQENPALRMSEFNEIRRKLLMEITHATRVLMMEKWRSLSQTPNFTFWAREYLAHGRQSKLGINKYFYTGCALHIKFTNGLNLNVNQMMAVADFLKELSPSSGVTCELQLLPSRWLHSTSHLPHCLVLKAVSVCVSPTMTFVDSPDPGLGVKTHLTQGPNSLSGLSYTPEHVALSFDHYSLELGW